MIENIRGLGSKEVDDCVSFFTSVFCSSPHSIANLSV